MCLEIIREKFNPPRPEEETAWKFGAIVNGKFQTEWDGEHYEFGVWHQAKRSTSFRITPPTVKDDGEVCLYANGSNEIYPLGFHCFSDHQAGKRYANYISLMWNPSHWNKDGTENPEIPDKIPGKLVTVKIRNIIATGYNISYGESVIVAQEIMFVK